MKDLEESVHVNIHDSGCKICRDCPVPRDIEKGKRRTEELCDRLKAGRGCE